MAWDQNFSLPERGFFSEQQLGQVAAIFRAIQPVDAERGIPGAAQAGAHHFLDLLLAPGSPSDYAEISDWQARYPVWLAALDTAARARTGKALSDLDEAAITTFLEALEAGKLEGVSDQALIFKTLWRHCLQGCWSDSRWGGNRDRIMWRWMGYLQEAETLDLAGGHGA